MNRRSLIALASMVSLAVWHKPIINSVMLPAHAQTSCSSIGEVDVIGNWLFTDTLNQTVEIEFIDESTLRIDNRSFTQSWRIRSDDMLILEVRLPAASWRANITREENCVASEITITFADSTAGEFPVLFEAPLIGVRI